MDIRDQFVQRVVPGRTFADIGGLWGTVNEKVSVASAAGAARLAMVDVTLPATSLWQLFEQRMAGLGIENCEKISADVCQLASQPGAPIFDVVHCSGVLYHHPSPLTLILALRKVTAHYLILTSAITQYRVENEHGTYVVPPSGVLFVPALDSQERQILAQYWKDKAGVESCLGISEPVKWNAEDFGPWWWLPTATSMTAMCESCGFRLVDSALSWNDNALTLLLEAQPG